MARTQKTKTRRIVGVMFVAMAGTAFFLCLRMGNESRQDDAIQNAPFRIAVPTQKNGASRGTKTRASATSHASTLSGTRGQFVATTDRSAAVCDDDAHPQSSADLARLARMDALLDDDQNEEAFHVACTLLKSSDETIRRKAVDGLGWIGLSAFPELTEALGDSAESVSEDAFEQWMQQADELEGTETLATFLNAAMETLSDSERLERVVMLYDRLSDDVAVRNLALVISSTAEQNAVVARNHYEFITGEPFTTLQAAEAWIQENGETAME